MNIEESNELIAKFMGNEVAGPGIPMGIWFEDTKDFIQFQDLKYNSSWDWLMPVVEKIEQLRHNASPGDITFDLMKETIDSALSEARIEYAYQSIINFILWYNKNEENKDIEYLHKLLERALKIEKE
jgi:hypothetical protein